MSTPIFGPPYVPPFLPLANITPFTYRDGATYAQILQELENYINDSLIPFVNENFGGLGENFETEVNALITQVEAALTTQTDNVNGQLAAMTTLVNAAVAQLIAGSVVAQDSVVAGIVNNPASATRIALNAIYTAVSDSAVAAFVNNVASATRIALAAIFRGKETGNLQVYTNDGAGAPSKVAYTDAATVSTIMARDAAGKASIVAPTAAANIANKSYVDAAITSLQAATASTEDLFLSTRIESAIVSANTSFGIFRAPYPCRVISLDISRDVAVDQATSDTNFWLTRVRKNAYDSVANTNLATKTTRVTAATEPAGEAWLGLKRWSYDTALFTGATLAADDRVSVVMAPLGKVTAAGVTFTDAGDIVTVPSHGCVVGDRIQFAGIASTTGITNGVDYYVISVPTANTLTISATPGGAILPLTTNGTATSATSNPSPLSGPFTVTIGYQPL